MCDKIVIAGIPVDVAPIRVYIRKYKKHHDDYDFDKLIYKLLESADYGDYNDQFKQELKLVIDNAMVCPRCYVFVDREGTCEECGYLVTVKDSINRLEKIADISRRS